MSLEGTETIAVAPINIHTLFKILHVISLLGSEPSGELSETRAPVRQFLGSFHQLRAPSLVGFAFKIASSLINHRVGTNG